jgi:hypothetical protein
MDFDEALFVRVDFSAFAKDVADILHHVAPLDIPSLSCPPGSLRYVAAFT